MDKIVVGIFEEMDSAQEALNELQAKGFKRADIDLRSGENVINRWEGDRNEGEQDGFWSSIKHFFGGSGSSSTDDAAERGVSGVSETDVVLTVHASEATADQAAEILDDCGALNLDERASSTTDTDAIEEKPRVAMRGAPNSASRAAGTEKKIPVVEEELKVGKREVSSGGVRLRSRIIERPVEAELSLRDEKVRVERQPVDRPVSAGDGAFQEQTFEVRETTEEPVVEKRARVKEEVSVTKESRQRKETVRDTVRRTDVQVEQLSPEEQREFASYERDFQNDWQAKYAGTSGLKYQEVLPGYQYGYRLGRNAQYGDGDWSTIEPQVKRDWDQRGLGPWERFKDAVRSGWERSHGH